MKTSSTLLLTSLLAMSAFAANADPKSEVEAAMKKLGSQPNYSWTFTPKSEGSESIARMGPVEGKTEKDGLVWLKGTYRETSFEAAAKGTKYALNYSGEWMAVDEDSEETGRYARQVKSLKN